MDMKELWEQVCQMMQESLPTLTFRTFISPNLQPVQLDTTTLYLRSQLPKEMVSPEFVSAMKQFACQLAKQDLSVRVLSKDEPIPEAMPVRNAVRTPAHVNCNPNYTFDNFVVGGSNNFAYAAAVAVAQNPATIYNPLFIHGGVGLGKTHLMHAIGNYVHEEHPEKKLLYITSETFTNELILSIQQGNNTEFRNRYRNVDILMVDDIQFIAGKDATQEEFFNTFNALYNAGKQIVMTSDRPPQAIAHLEERLRSRFVGGLLCDIQKPDIETRIAILRTKAKREKLDISDDVLQLIAESTDSNIRELEGNLTRLVAYAKLVKEPVTLSLCKTALREVLNQSSGRQRVITVDLIMQTVAEYYSLTSADLSSATRRREVAVPRQIAIYLTRELTSLSLPQIGTHFGNRDHSTIIHSIDKIASGVKNTSSDLSSQVLDLRQMIQGTR